MLHSVEKSSASQPRTSSSTDAWDDGVEHEDFKALTREEAAAWRKAQRPLSLWLVFRWQFALASVAVVLAGLLGDWRVIALSVAYGSCAVMVPTALMAWRTRERAAVSAQSALMQVFVWESVRVLLAILLLASAPLVLGEVSWLGLVAGFVVVLKAYGVVVLFHAKRRD